MLNIQSSRIKFSGLKTLIICIFFSSLYAQTQNQDQAKEYESLIFAEAFLFESDSSGKGRVDVYVQVPYSEINFAREEDQYVGSLEVSAAVFSQDKQPIWQKSQVAELKLNNFSQTVSSRHSVIRQFLMDLSPGKYELLLEIKDQESKKMSTLRRSVGVKDFSLDTLALSDLMLIYRMDVEGARKNVVPNLSGVLEKEQGDFFLFFEIYNHVLLDSVQLLCKFIDPKQAIVMQRTRSEKLSGNRTQVIWQIDAPAFAAGKYALKVEALGFPSFNPSIECRASVSRSCVLRMKNLPLTITDIDKATDQLLYIAKESEIDYIREATIPDEKRKRFLEFWAKRDPDPKTVRNELMEEYYARVAYANRNYSNYMEGWKTDRGMVLIRFGPPQNVDRHPFDSDKKPYEIWYYYDQNREFIFVDETGFGDYRLRYPTTDLWGRIR